MPKQVMIGNCRVDDSLICILQYRRLVPPHSSAEVLRQMVKDDFLSLVNDDIRFHNTGILRPDYIYLKQ